MNKFDDYIKEKAKEESVEVPENVSKAVENALASLPETNKSASRIKIFPKILSTAACVVFFFLVLMPNFSKAYAKSLADVPVIGRIVKVVTIRNYFYSDDNHEMEINVPRIEDESGAADYINKDVEELTKILADKFDEERKAAGNEGYGAIYVDYDVVTNTDKWFTLKITVHETAGSSNTYYKYYHIDKTKGEIVKLSDIAENDEFYSTVEAEIKRQMKQRMKNDSDAVYWVDSEDFGQNFEKLEADCNFYWNKKGEFVIVFDKYEVAPGSMGTPEFTIGKSVTDKVIKPEYKDIKG